MAKKLYKLAPASFHIPLFTDANGQLKTRKADGIPFVHWPDGSWCLPANLYMQELYRRGLSTKNGGGTLATYAAGLTHLIRFCWDTRSDPRELSNDDFARFIKQLSDEPCPRYPGQKARSSNRVVDVGRVCLDFLDSYARHLGDASMVGPDGRIRCERKTARIKTRRKDGSAGEVQRQYWHHHAFPQRDPLRKRLPISAASIALLRAATMECSASRHQRKRRLAVLKLLEMTGGRRGEAARLEVKSVREAAAMEHPMLRLPTLKKRKDEDRLVPVHSHDLQLLLEYIDVNRSRVIREKLGKSKDHGIVLIGETSGQPLDVETITREISTLAKQAGLTGKACAHMFRHRFITKIFVSLIESHRLTNADEFRRFLLDGEAIKRKVMEWTGHGNIASLEPYIHLAFDEFANIKKTYSRMNTHMAIDSFVSTIEQTLLEIKSAGSHREQAVAILATFSSQLADLKRELLGLDRMAEEADLEAA